MIDKTPLQALFAPANWPAFGLLVLVILSGFGVSYVSYENRLLHTAIQKELEKRNNIQVEWGQLLLEQSTLTSPGHIEKLAKGKLNMEVPQAKDIEMILP